MKYREFGRTGIQVSELVFGGGAVGGLLIDRDTETKRKALERAVEAGINWIDTAAAYGQGRSEAALGELLPGIEPRPYLSTKFAIDTRDTSDVAGQIERSLTASLERLRQSSVTLLQLHNRIGPETRGRTLGVSEILKSGGVLDVLERLREQGMIRHLGITALGDRASILEVIESSRIDSAQVYFNLLNPTAAFAVPSAWPAFDFGGVLAACERHGVAAMNIRVFSAGVIATQERTGRELPLTHGDSVESEAEKARRVFARLGEDYGTRAQTALRFALAEPRLACVIFGLAQLAHLEEALAGAELGPLPDAGLTRLRAVYTEGLAPS